MTSSMRRLTVSFGIFLLSLTLFGQEKAKASKPEPIRVVLVGDSTVALQGGWGPGFCVHLIASAECLDVAANGRSTKSYIDEGLWAKALKARGQFYFIQFGHNDQKNWPALHTDPDTSFKANLHLFVREVRQIGGTPILVTSLSRRNYVGQKLSDRNFDFLFKTAHPLRDYAAATREVATEDHVPLIDLFKLSRALLKPMTQKQADRYDANTHDGVIAAKPDRTHLNELGKKTFGDMVARSASRNVPALRPYIELSPARSVESVAR